MSIVQKQFRVGALFAIISALAYAGYGLTSKILQQEHVPIPSIAFFLFFICFLLNFPRIAKNGLSQLKTSHPILLIFRSLAGLFAVLFLLYPIKYIPLIDAMMLHNTAHLFIPFISFFLLREKLSKTIWIGLGLGLVGITMIFFRGQDTLNFPVFIALLSGVSVAFAMVFSRKLVRTEPVSRILFYYFSIGMLLTAPSLAFNWHPYHWSIWVLLILGGFITYACIYLFSSSLKRITATTASILYYLTIVFSGLFDWILWDQIPSLLDLLDIALVTTGGILSMISEKNDIVHSKKSD